MKNIATAIFLGCIALTNAQVIIGDAVGTVPLTPLSVPGVPNKTSVLLEFAAGQNKGIIVPYLTVPLPLASAANRGTILLDASDATKARLKYSNETGWVDLSGQDANLYRTLASVLQPHLPHIRNGFFISGHILHTAIRSLITALSDFWTLPLTVSFITSNIE